MYYRNDVELSVKSFAKVALFNNNDAYIRRNPIDIYDLNGPLLFLDYIVVSKTGQKGWVRFMPDAASSVNGGIVSAEHGNYPYKVLGKPSMTMLSKNYGFAEIYSSNLSRALITEYKLNPNLQTSVKFYCYSYPNIGVVIEKNGAIYVKDLISSRFYPISDGESGDQEVHEAIKPYSFLRRMSESGDPGIIEFPIPDYKIPNITLIPQKRDNWCAAASCQMILKFFDVDIDQETIAKEMKIPESSSGGGASLSNQLLVYQKYLGNLNFIADTTPLGQECIVSIQRNHPLKNGIFQHAQVIGGWTVIDGKKYFLIYDPLPVNKGSIKPQNPSIVWPINYILTNSL